MIVEAVSGVERGRVCGRRPQAELGRERHAKLTEVFNIIMAEQLLFVYASEINNNFWSGVVVLSQDHNPVVRPPVPAQVTNITMLIKNLKPKKTPGFDKINK